MSSLPLIPPSRKSEISPTHGRIFVSHHIRPTGWTKLFAYRNSDFSQPILVDPAITMTHEFISAVANVKILPDIAIERLS